jgi:probable F420-dependent oxidoreductase
MTEGLTFGVMLPSFATATNRITDLGLRDACREIEALGFDSIWVIDHFLSAPMYGQTWLDPLLTLAFVAAHTVRVKIGTAVLVLPLRNPVLVAKDVATLQLLSRNRLVLGVGAGWNPLEFEAVQVARRERGERTDESIDILRLLLDGRPGSYAGSHFRFPQITIEPAMAEPPPIWIGGGSQPVAEGSTGNGNRVPQSVIRRIAAADGWISPSTSPPDLIAADWARIRSTATQMGRDPDSILFAHMNSFHLIDTQDRDRAHREQRQAFTKYLGSGRPWKFAEQCYLVGTLDDITRRIQERAALGVRYFILGPITADPGELSYQLRLLLSRILPAVG